MTFCVSACVYMRMCVCVCVSVCVCLYVCVRVWVCLLESVSVLKCTYMNKNFLVYIFLCPIMKAFWATFSLGGVCVVKKNRAPRMKVTTLGNVLID